MRPSAAASADAPRNEPSEQRAVHARPMSPRRDRPTRLAVARNQHDDRRLRSAAKVCAYLVSEWATAPRRITRQTFRRRRPASVPSSRMGFSNVHELEVTPIWDGVRARTLHGERTPLAWVELAPGAVVPPHSHDNEQM